MTLKIVTDIETLSTRSDAAVIGIGAVAVLDGNIVDQIEFLIRPDDACEWGHVDPKTCQWWAGQTNYARAWAGTEDTVDVVEEMDEWYRDLLEVYAHHEVEIWANPPSFDYVILQNLWRKFDREWPFSFRSERDFRTMFKFAETLGPIVRVEPEDPHMPLSDAMAEAQTLIHMEHFLNEHIGHDDVPTDADLPRADETPSSVPSDRTE